MFLNVVFFSGGPKRPRWSDLQLAREIYQMGAGWQDGNPTQFKDSSHFSILLCKRVQPFAEITTSFIDENDWENCKRRVIRGQETTPCWRGRKMPHEEVLSAPMWCTICIPYTW
jgi:hypothetical protein